MKYFAFVALLALVSAAEEKKPLAEKPEELKQQPQQQHLTWPLPDPQSEGDLMLHGSISFDRVQQLHKQKLENDEDKATWSHGRQFLRRVLQFLEQNNDFKVPAVLCRDTRNLNATNNRWEIDIQNQPQSKEAVREKQIQSDEPAKEKSEKADDVPHSSNKTSNETQINAAIATTVKPPVNPGQDTYEQQRDKFYDQVGSNFARLLIREHRKEQLSQEETQYLARWNADEAVHYGAAAIYCNEGENVNQIKKQINTYLQDEKNQ